MRRQARRNTTRQSSLIKSRRLRVHIITRLPRPGLPALSAHGKPGLAMTWERRREWIVSAFNVSHLLAPTRNWFCSGDELVSPVSGKDELV
jgi:hypothetical protein